MALVLNALIVVAGLAAYYGVDVRELPDVDRPVVTVSTDFESAAAETVDRELTSAIEGAVSRVSGVKSISSSSSFGNSRVTVEFNDDVDLNVAAADMRDAISRISNTLPDDADPPRIVKADANSDAVMRLAVTSNIMAVEDMTVLVEDQIEDVLASVPGVADVQINGNRSKIFRIDINQGKVASLGMNIADIRNALNTMAFDTPAGQLNSNDQSIVVRAQAPVQTPEDFENIIIKGQTKIRDVATVTMGPDIGTSTLRANGKAGIGLGIIRQAQSNTLDISAGVRAAVAQLQKTLPEGVDIRVTSDDADFVNGAVHEVEIALGVSVIIIILIIYLFLWDIRATLIPAVALPVALIGTISAIYLAGFSINILTLLALVLATGLVVDDAIVVLENIVRRRNQGMGPRAAAVLGTQEVFFAVVATTVTLAAVFVPLSFLPGQTGGLFREFGFVLAICVLLSAVVALTLCPMLASRLLSVSGAKHEDVTHAPGLVARIGGSLGGLYRRLLHACLAGPWIVVVISLLFAGGAFGAFSLLKQELTPPEDRASAFLRITAPQGVSLEYLGDEMRKIETLIQPLRDSGEIQNTFSIAGQNGNTNRGFMVLSLATWKERARSQQEIITDVSRRVRNVPGIQVFAAQPNSLGIRGAGNGLQFAVVGTSYSELGTTAAKLVSELEKDSRFDRPRLTNEPTQPQLAVSIDRERASDLGIDITGLAQALQSVLDGYKIGSVYIEDRSFDVKLVSTTNPINDPTDLENVFLRTGDGRFVPMSTIAKLTEVAVPPALTREQQMRSVAITSGLSSDFALGDAYRVAQEVAAPLLPPGYRHHPARRSGDAG